MDIIEVYVHRCIIYNENVLLTKMKRKQNKVDQLSITSSLSVAELSSEELESEESSTEPRPW